VERSSIQAPQPCVVLDRHHTTTTRPRPPPRRTATPPRRSPGSPAGPRRSPKAARTGGDRKNKVPVRQCAGLPQFKKRDRSLPTMNYSRQGFTLRDGHLTLAGGSRSALSGRASCRPRRVPSASTRTPRPLVRVVRRHGRN